MQSVKVYAAGVFDILHHGHVRYLEAARAMGDILIVGLLTDDGAARYKPRPVMTYEERHGIVNALRCVDVVMRQDDTDPTETLKVLYEMGIKIDVLVRGTDYEGTPPGTAFVESIGGIVRRIPYTKEISSSDIKRRMDGQGKSEISAVCGSGRA